MITLILIPLLIVPFSPTDNQETLVNFEFLQQLINQKDNEKILFYLNNILEKNSNDYVTLYMKGTVLYEMEKYNSALENYEKALKIDPENIIVLKNIGKTLVILEEYERAIVYFDKILEIDPFFVEVLNYKGFALYNLAKYNQAITYFEEALRVQPDYIRAVNNKGITLANLGSYQKALEYFDEALEINPTYLKAIFNKGLTHYYMGNFEKSIQYYDKAIKIMPEKNDILNQKKYAIVAIQISDDDDKNLIFPEWFRNNVNWFHNGKITQKDLLNGMEHLVDLEIIKLSPFYIPK